MLLRRLARMLLYVAVVAGAGTVALAWRLGSGPIELPWLAARLESAANDGGGPVRWSVGRAALAWEGFSEGFDRPLDIRIGDLAAVSTEGTPLARVPEARVTLSVARLLQARVVPRVIELRGVVLRLVREPDGRFDLAPGSLSDAMVGGGGDMGTWLAMLARPPGSDAGRDDGVLSQLRHIGVRAGSLVIEDRRWQTRWEATEVSIDLRRQTQGGAALTLSFEAAAGSQRARFAGRGDLAAGGETLTLEASLSDLDPARLAAEIPALDALAAVDLPVGLKGRLVLDRDLVMISADGEARLGAGRVLLGRGALPVARGAIEASATPRAVTLHRLAADIAVPGGKVSHLNGTGRVRRETDGVSAHLALDLDRVAFADLPDLWPDGVGGKGTKAWITENITAGTASGLHVALDARAGPDLSGITVTSIRGGLEGADMTVHWLRPVPPVEGVGAHLSFVSPDALEIAVQGGRQGGLKVTGGTVRISGLAGADQFADIAVDIAGPVADAIGLLRHPRLRLLERRPVPLRDPAGTMQGRIEIERLPLESSVSLDDLRVRATADLAGVRLRGIAAGHDLEDGRLALAASNDGLKVQGTAQLAGIPAKLQVDMDFRPGGAAQVVQAVNVSGIADARQLAGFGLDLGGLVEGKLPLTVAWRTQRDGRGDISLRADLSEATLALKELAFRKPPGKPAQAEIRASLQQDRITAVDRLLVQGEGVSAEARIAFADGKPAEADIARLALGTTTDLRAKVRFPARPGAPWIAEASGASLDVSGAMERRDADAAKTAEKERPPYIADVRLDRLILGPGRTIRQVVLHADNDGRINRQLRLSGRPGGSAPLEMTIGGAPGARTLALSAGDTGALLKALDVMDDMQGGTLKVAGRYDDARADHALRGTATLTDFRMVKAPALAKLLQAMTLYGVMEMLQGPGLAFNRLEAPFTLADDVLSLEDARAFNSSLGMTAKGRIDLATRRCDVQGTIVPAYILNTLLGSIPFVGRLFSPEQGGGLFAATYTLTGDCGDPRVAVNPLAALTPGFLRGLFGVFDAPAQPGAPQQEPRTPQR
jgi:hypothetical protein